MITIKKILQALAKFKKQKGKQKKYCFWHIKVSKIPKNTYKNQNHTIETFASQLLLATSSSVESSLIQNFVTVVFEH